MDLGSLYGEIFKKLTALDADFKASKNKTLTEDGILLYVWLRELKKATPPYAEVVVAIRASRGNPPITNKFAEHLSTPDSDYMTYLLKSLIEKLDGQTLVGSEPFVYKEAEFLEERDRGTWYFDAIFSTNLKI